VKIAGCVLALLLMAPFVWAATVYDSVSAEYISCYDGDTCRFNILHWPPIVGWNISVRILGIDTPEMRGKCDEEKALAKLARDFVRDILKRARVIDLRQIQRGKYFRLLAHVYADGRSIGKSLILRNLARPYDGGTREGWC